MSPRRLLSLVAVLIATVLCAPRLAHAQTVDVIRGRVTGPDSLPIANVTVTATTISGNVNRVSRTDRNGRFTITFPGGDGDYMMSMVAVGYAQKRFEVKRTADEDVLLADARLTKVGAVLDAVKIAGSREKPNRNEVANAPDVGGTERRVDAAALPPDQMGDIAAMAASLPGVNMVPGENGDPNGWSMYGLGTDQNNTTLNGMNFGGGNLPRDAAVGSSLNGSPYDVSRGGFSGGQFGLRTRPGTNFLTRGMSLNLDAPQLQWADPAARSLGREYTSASLGGVVSGPVKYDKSFYNVSYQLGRRSNDLQSLLNTDALGLQAAGVSADSVLRLLSLVQSSRVPSTVPGLPGSQLSDQGSLLGAFDMMPPSSTSGQAFNLTASGGWSKTNPASGLTLELPSHSGERTNWNAGLQARHSNFYRNMFLSETSVSLGESRNWSSPYLALPSGVVRVNSTLDDGTNSLQPLQFGGNQGLRTSALTSSIGAMNQLSWVSVDNRHRFKLTSELRTDRQSQDMTTNLLGTFSYLSLADLEANRPASYFRALSPRTRSAGEMVGAISLGDSYRPSRDLQLQLGVRVDGNRFLNTPNENPAVAQAFGVSNDHVPNFFSVSPRVGFSWTYGTAPQIGAFDGAFRGPRAVVRGGAGVFQNVPGTSLIGSALDNTGLASAVQQLSCIGVATPIPDWNSFVSGGAVPDRCADGTTGSVFANSAPNVALFDSKYMPQRSIRSNLQWNGPVLKDRFMATLEGTYSRNLNQTSFVDLNFAPTQRFGLVDENGRPVFVSPTSIVPSTGGIASTDARVSPLFSRVTQMRTDLTSESRQLRLSISPLRFSSSFGWGLSYVYGNNREQTRGFSSTGGNPLDVQWGRSSFDGRHQFTYNLSYNAFDFIRFNWSGRVQSGSPFTPMIVGDVNGDGYGNDRAFIFDPSKASDPALASAMQSLLANGSSAARDCLSGQLGRIASRNGCQGPWTSTANLSFSFNPLKVRMPQRATLSFNVSNPLGAADLLLHGENKVRGWGQTPFPDASLLYVRGFDQNTQRYKYEVNRRFGSTSPQSSAFRAPVTLTAMMRFDVAPTRERQFLTQQLDRGRRTQGTKAPEGMLKLMYGTGGIQNPMATILRQQDSLHLTAPQADSLASMNRRYIIKLDSIWSPITAYFGKLPDNYDRGEAYDRYRRAREASVDILSGLAPSVRNLLSAEQRRKLPSFITMSLDNRYLASIRSGTAGFTGGGIPGMSGGGPMMMMGGMGAGGGTFVIQSR